MSFLVSFIMIQSRKSEKSWTSDWCNFSTLEACWNRLSKYCFEWTIYVFDRDTGWIYLLLL